MPAPAYRRKIFLINKKFQLRFAFYVCSWLVILSLAYPLIISSLFDYFIRYLAADPMGPGLALLEKARQEIFIFLIVMEVALIGLAFLISLFMSHKVAGPIYKMRKFFLEARNGNLEQSLFLRKNDYFTEMVPAYNEMMSAIRMQISHKQNKMDAAIQKLELLLPTAHPEQKNRLQEILTSLKEIENT